MKKLFTIMIFLSSYSFANLYNNSASFSEISKNIPKLGSIKCKFKQEKHLQNIQKPLVSSGDFEFIENKGVYFYTKFPIESTTDFTNEKYKQINDIVSAVSNKKYSRLEREFDFYFEGDNSNWSLGLKPKKNSKAFNYISSITLIGKSYINKITINQTNGNKTVIWFTK